MGQPDVKSTKKYTYGDYLTWPEGERWEIIEGTAYMCAAPNRAHQKVSSIIGGMLYVYLQDKTCEYYAAPFDVRLPKEKQNDKETENVVQPDIVVICDISKLDDKGCKGAPDFIIEILSPSSLSVDYITKLHLYEKHGVREYWIVHPVDKVVMVYLLNKKGKYEMPVIYMQTDKIKVSIFDELTINLEEVFK